MIIKSFLFLSLLTLQSTAQLASRVRGGNLPQCALGAPPDSCIPVGVDDVEPPPPRRLQEDPQIYKHWILNGDSLVIDNVPALLPHHLGTLTLSYDTDDIVRGRYSLANDIDFLMTRRSPQEIHVDNSSNSILDKPRMFDGFWTMQITGSTKVVGLPMEQTIETAMKQLFLNDNAILQVRVDLAGQDPSASWRPSTIFVSVDDGSSSIQLVPLPFMRAHWYKNQRRSVAGYWETTVSGESDLKLSLKITPVSPRTYACSLEGFNKYDFRFKRVANSEIVVGLISSTTLQVEGEDDAWEEERRIIDLLSVARHVAVTTTMRAAGVEMNALAFETADGQKVEFIRPQFIDQHHPSHLLKPTYWVWIPSTLVVSKTSEEEALKAANRALQSQHVVVLEMWKYLSEATAFDVYVDGVAYFRTVMMPTGTHEPLVSVTQLAEFPEDLRSGGQHAQQFLEQLKAVEIDSHDGYITLVGTQASLSFRSIPTPSVGTWVLDRRFSSLHGTPMRDGATLARRVSLKISQRGEQIHGLLAGTTAVFRFEFQSDNILQGNGNWTVRNIASRRGSEDSSIDIELAAFFSSREDIQAKVIQHDNVEFLMLTSEHGQLSFVHPKALTAAMVGQWKLREFMYEDVKIPFPPAMLTLRSMGVGALGGRLRVANTFYGLKFHESLNLTTTTDALSFEETSGVTPTAWTVDAIRLPSHLGLFRFNRRHRRNYASLHEFHMESYAGDESTPEAVPSELKEFDRVIAEHVVRSINIELAKNQTEMTMRGSPGLLVVFDKVLDPEVQYEMLGKWEIQFVIIDHGADDDKKNAVAIANGGAKKQSHPRLHVDISLSPTQDPLPALPDTSEEWRPTSVTVFDGVAYDDTNRVIVKWKMSVNANGVLWMTDVEVFHSSAAHDSNKHKLEQWLIKFVTLGTTVPKVVEASKFELLIADESSMLALSREPNYAQLPIMTMMVVHGTTVQFRQDEPPKASSYPSREHHFDRPSEDTSLSRAVTMIRTLKRRLQAADHLDTIVGAESGSSVSMKRDAVL